MEKETKKEIKKDSETKKRSLSRSKSVKNKTDDKINSSDSKITIDKLDVKNVNQETEFITNEDSNFDPMDDLIEKPIVSELEEKKEDKSQTELELEKQLALQEKKTKPRLGPHGEIYAPELSLPDDITDDEIESFIKSTHIEDDEEDDPSQYKGLSEEEIKDLKERKRKLKELQARYNSKETKKSDIGEYKKNLDFSVNTSIKRFKLKPPKKPFIIAGLSVLGAAIIAIIIVAIVFTRPPAPVTLASINISQEYTNQYVGESVDIRGLYINCTYSDGSTKKIKVTEDMIAGRSPNISQSNFISSFNSDTYVYFKYGGKQTKLNIRLTDIDPTSMSASFLQLNICAGDTLYFDNILVLISTNVGQIRINAKDISYSTDREGVMDIVDNGLVFAEEGVYQVLFAYDYNGYHLNSSITVSVNEAPEPEQDPAEEPTPQPQPEPTV